MIAKIFEVRDAGTFMPVLAVKLETDNEHERYLLRRTGYANPGEYVVLWRLTGGDANYDVYEWNGRGRTIPHAHQYILDHFDELETGSVVDVEFILGETPKPKESEGVTSGW